MTDETMENMLNFQSCGFRPSSSQWRCDHPDSSCSSRLLYVTCFCHFLQVGFSYHLFYKVLASPSFPCMDKVYKVYLSFPRSNSLFERQVNKWCFLNSLLRVFVLTVVFGLFHGLGLLPVLLAHFGPPGGEEDGGSLPCLPSPASSASSASTSSSSIPTSLSWASDSLPTASAQKQWDDIPTTIDFDMSSLPNQALKVHHVHHFFCSKLVNVTQLISFTRLLLMIHTCMFCFDFLWAKCNTQPFDTRAKAKDLLIHLRLMLGFKAIKWER